MSLRKKLYTLLYRWSRQKVRTHSLKKHGCDIKCPNCNEWFSVSGIDWKHEHVSEPDWGFHVRCGKCGHESYWNAVAAPILMLCDESGNPYSQENLKHKEVDK